MGSSAWVRRVSGHGHWTENWAGRRAIASVTLLACVRLQVDVLGDGYPGRVLVVCLLDCGPL